MINLSFAGCGFLGIYHVGVASCFREYAPHVLVSKIAGASVGSIAAAALICDVSLGQTTTDILAVAVKARSQTLGPLSPRFDLNSLLKERLENALPQDAHIRCTGRLFISVTRWSDKQNVLLSQFNSRQELIQALLCSCFIPVYSGVAVPTFQGERYVDGGMSNNLPVLDSNTVTVSPFAGEHDICPQDESCNILQVNLANTSIAVSPGNIYRIFRILFPPKPEILNQMCQQGFDDALKFLQRKSIITCTRCLGIQSVVQLKEPDFDTHLKHSFDDCADCRYKRQMASLGSLPEAVVDAFRVATELDEKHAKLGQSFEDFLIDFCVLLNYVYPNLAKQAGYDGSIEDITQWFSKQRFSRLIAYSIVLSSTLSLNLSFLLLQYSLAIQDACDQVNKGIVNWLYRRRPVRLFSYLTLPYTLPLDISIVIFAKVWNQLPSLRKEMLSKFQAIVDLTKLMLKKFDPERKVYKAMFSCELAITEYDYTPEEQIDSSFSLLSQTGQQPCTVTTEEEIKPKRKLSIRDSLPKPTIPKKRMQRKSYAGFANTVPIVVQEPVRRKSFSEVSRPERVIRNMKFGFTVGLQSEVRKEDKQKDFFHSLKSLADEDNDLNIMQLANKALKMERQYISQYMASNNEDKVGQVLERPDSEAIMSYCYVDEDKSVKITEIYNVTDADGSMKLSEEERRLNSQLQWENNWINPPELNAMPPKSIADMLDDEEFNLSDAECDLPETRDSYHGDSDHQLESVESDGYSMPKPRRKKSFMFVN